MITILSWTPAWRGTVQVNSVPDGGAGTVCKLECQRRDVALNGVSFVATASWENIVYDITPRYDDSLELAPAAASGHITMAASS